MIRILLIQKNLPVQVVNCSNATPIVVGVVDVFDVVSAVARIAGDHRLGSAFDQMMSNLTIISTCVGFGKYSVHLGDQIAYVVTFGLSAVQPCDTVATD